MATNPFASDSYNEEQKEETGQSSSASSETPTSSNSNVTSYVNEQPQSSDVRPQQSVDPAAVAASRRRRSSGGSSSSSSDSNQDQTTTEPSKPEPTPKPEPQPYHVTKDRHGNITQSHATKEEYDSFRLEQAKRESIDKGREYINYQGKTLFTQSKNLSQSQRAAVGEVKYHHDRKRLETYAQEKKITPKVVYETKGGVQTKKTIYVDMGGREIGRVTEQKQLPNAQPTQYVYDSEKKQTRPATFNELLRKGQGQSIDPWVAKTNIEKALGLSRNKEAPQVVAGIKRAEAPQSEIHIAQKRNLFERAKDTISGIINRAKVYNVATGLSIQDPITSIAKSEFGNFKVFGALNAVGYMLEGKMSIKEGASKIYQDMLRKPISDPITNMPLRKEIEIRDGVVVNQRDITLGQAIKEPLKNAYSIDYQRNKEAKEAELIFFGKSGFDKSDNEINSKNHNGSNNHLVPEETFSKGSTVADDINFSLSRTLPKQNGIQNPRINQSVTDGFGVVAHDSKQNELKYKNVFETIADFGVRVSQKPQEFKNLVVTEIKSVSASGKLLLLEGADLVVNYPGEVLVGATVALPVISAGSAVVTAVAGSTGAVVVSKAVSGAAFGSTFVLASKIDDPIERRSFLQKNLIIDVAFLGGQKILDAGANVYRRVGSKFVDPSDVFDAKVLKGKSTFPMSNNVDDALQQFQKTKNADGIVVTHTAPSPIKDTTIGAGPMGAKNMEDVGLYVTPAGRGSPHFLGLSQDMANVEISYSIFPQARKPRVVRVGGVQNVKRIPEPYIQMQGFEESNIYLESQAGSGNVFITKRSEIGMRGLTGKGTGTSELEAVIPKGANIEKTTTTTLGKLKGYDEVTEFRGTIVPIEDFNLLTGQVTAQKSAKQTTQLESSLSRSSSEYVSKINVPIGSIPFVSAAEPPEGYYDDLSTKKDIVVVAEIPPSSKVSSSEPISDAPVLISSSAVSTPSEPTIAVSSSIPGSSKSSVSSSQSIPTSEALSMISEASKASSPISSMVSRAAKQSSSPTSLLSSRVSSPYSASRIYGGSSGAPIAISRPTAISRPPRIPSFPGMKSKQPVHKTPSLGSSRKGQYTSSIAASMLGIKSKKKGKIAKLGELTGITIRPMIEDFSLEV